ncbi:putative gustatory receptor 2a [Musca vetustissima]|uniref:putative gustatory receptor 2a n=1 Tax=Musca vetustissima TaxID=27455 RepID=UPI002AB5FFB1|nr:putative gustatory receptor 2a [Musca vetustissima]
MEIMETVAIFQLIYQITNLAPWALNRKTGNFERSRALEIYGMTILAISTILLFYGLFGKNALSTINSNDIGKTVDFIQLVGIRVAHIVSIAEALMRREDQKKFYEQLMEIDHIFEKSLNRDMHNGIFHSNTVQRGALMLSIYIICEIFILIAHVVANDNENFPTYWIFYVMPLIICGLRYFQMFTAIRLIQRRLNALTQVINEINLHEPTKAEKEVFTKSLEPIKLGATQSNPNIFELSLQKRQEMENADMKRLLIIRDLYNRLFVLTELYNQYFGISMLINLGNDFISITSNCYWIFINFKNFASTTKDFLQIAGSTVWSIPHLLNVLVLAILCDRTMGSTTSMALGLHRIHIDTFNDNHNSVIQQFSLQLLHQKIKITAAGFFTIDCGLLYTIVGATTTYLIILIQFHLNEEIDGI